MTVNGTADGKVQPRERILDSAYQLIARRGVRDVGVEEVIATAGIAKATLYRHFPSMNDLVLAVLEHREQVWTLGLVEAEARRRGSTQQLATETGLRDAQAFARSWHILMKGSIVSAAEGDADAALRAKTMAASLIDQRR